MNRPGICVIYCNRISANVRSSASPIPYCDMKSSVKENAVIHLAFHNYHGLVNVQCADVEIGWTRIRTQPFFS